MAHETLGDEPDFFASLSTLRKTLRPKQKDIAAGIVRAAAAIRRSERQTIEAAMSAVAAVLVKERQKLRAKVVAPFEGIIDRMTDVEPYANAA